MTLRRILLADDDPNDVELTLAALEEANLANQVDIVRDGEEALDYLFTRGRFSDREPASPCVIMLDLKMPKVGGVEVLRAIRENDGLQNTPVVVLTSSKEGTDVDACYELGANAYVVKPVDFEQFSVAVRNLGLFWAVLNEPPRPS